MVELLSENPLLLLFLIIAVGYPFGRVSVAGARIGVAAVLFAGLGIGAIDPSLRLPEILYQFGLLLFVYPIGLATGPAFFAALRRQGLRDNLFVAAMIVFAASLAALWHWLLDIPGAVSAGLFAGSMNNTPALAAAIEALRGMGVEARSAPVIGYSIAYPFGVLGVIAALVIAQRYLRVDLAAEARTLAHLGATNQELESRTLRATHARAGRLPLLSLAGEEQWDVVFTRVASGDDVDLLDESTVLAPGDRVIAVGTPEALDRVQEYLGEAAEPTLELDRSTIDYRRIFVSSRKVAGRQLRELALPQRFGAVITRLRRGDVELLPNGGTVLQLGDRARVVARRDDLQRISDFFGDSYRALSEVDAFTFSLGLFLGLLVGVLPIPLGGGITLKLGLAGGPLLVGLVLGARGFTGRFVWTLPYSANMTLRQIGLILFLAGIGTQAGYSFVRTLASAQGLLLFAAGASITLLTALLTIGFAHYVLRMPFHLLLGTVAAVATQPAVLAYAAEQTKNDVPNLAYATVYPTAILSKIILAQLLVALLR